nr:hypothetical protein B0A51_12838 [Rachicladosporium sp. CCFEE 5018]
MDRLARDAQARYGSSSGGDRRGSSLGNGYYYTPYRDSIDSRRPSEHPFFSGGSGRRPSRRASNASPSRYELPREIRSPRRTIFNPVANELARAAASRDRDGPIIERRSLRQVEPVTRRGERYEYARRPRQSDWVPSFTPHHGDPPGRYSASAARQAERERADWHHSELFDAAESNRANAERWVREHHRVRDHDFGGTRTLNNYEVPARYGGGDRLTRQAADRATRGERRGSWHFF